MHQVEKAVELARDQGYQFMASFTENPRMKHLYGKHSLMLDERKDNYGWENITYVIDPELAEGCSDEGFAEHLRETELDTRPKRDITDSEESRFLTALRKTGRRNLAKAAREIQNTLAL